MLKVKKLAWNINYIPYFDCIPYPHLSGGPVYDTGRADKVVADLYERLSNLFCNICVRLTKTVLGLRVVSYDAKEK